MTSFVLTYLLILVPTAYLTKNENKNRNVQKDEKNRKKEKKKRYV